MGGLTAWLVHKSFFFVNVSVVTEPAKDINIPKNLLFFVRPNAISKEYKILQSKHGKHNHYQYEWGAVKTKKSSFNPAGQLLAFPSCIHLYGSLAIGAPVRTHQILSPPLDG